MSTKLSDETVRIRSCVRCHLYHSENREHAISVSKKYHEENREKILIRQKKWRDNNKEARKKYLEENKEKIVRYKKEYKKRNRDKFSMLESRRRARKAGSGGSHTIEQRREKFLQLGNVCYYCGIPGEMTVDHMIPISRGGTDFVDNIVPACQRCNSKKHDRTAQEFFESMTDADITMNLALVADYKATH